VEKKNEWRGPKRALRHFLLPESKNNVKSDGQSLP